MEIKLRAQGITILPAIAKELKEIAGELEVNFSDDGL
jgi:hypothetical protein